MHGLAEVVRGLTEREGVTAAVVVSSDGLPIHHAGQRVTDPEALSALTITLLRPAARLGESARSGELTRGVFEYADGLAVLTAVRGGNWLLVLTEPTADVGTLLYDLRRESPLLAAFL
jgi:predicted regulator of Ras-like GTPase activity (Roadblock/LC7/MglB family)